MALRLQFGNLLASTATLLLFGAGLGAAQNAKSPWHTNPADAVKEAKTENKPIFAVLH